MKSLASLVRRFLAVPAIVLSVGLASTASAASIDFLFNGNGFALPSDCTSSPPCLDVGAVGVADDWAGLDSPIPDSWAFFADFTLLLDTGSLSGSWESTDIGPGGNDLFGTFTGALQQLSPTLGKASIDYLVTGGNGIFAGAVGSGLSTVYLNSQSFNYVEAGSFSITPVPEPATWAMMLAGMFALGALTYRRRA